jgi:uncharacterized membrane protein YkoI
MLKKTLLLLFLIGITVGLTTVFAKKEHREQKLYDLLTQATVDLEQAVKRVEVQMKSKVYKAQLERGGKRKHVFEVYALIDQEVTVIIIDPRSGQIINATEEGIWEKLTERSLKKAAQVSKIPMSQAISIAQKACKGKASRARLELSDGLVHYVIDVHGWDDRCEVLVDSENGEFFKSPGKERKH